MSSGKGAIFIDDKKSNLSEGDVFIINPKQKSYILADNLKIITITKPNWYSDQCEVVKK